MQCRRPSPLHFGILSKTTSCLTGPTKSLPMNLSCHKLQQDFSFRTYNPTKAEIFALHPTSGTRFPCISGPLFNLLIGRWVSVVDEFSDFCLLFVLFRFLFGLGLFLIWDFIVLFSPVLETNLEASSKCSTTKPRPQLVPLCSSMKSQGNKKTAFIFLRFPKWTSDSWLVTGLGWGAGTEEQVHLFRSSFLASLLQYQMKQDIKFF